MLCTYLYNTKSNELRLQDDAELLNGVPDAAEAHEKRVANGLVHRGAPQCRADEFVWVDVTAPSAEDYQMLKERFSLHPMVLEDIHVKEGRPKLHNYSDYIYIIFHAIQYIPREEDLKTAQDKVEAAKTDDDRASAKIRLKELFARKAAAKPVEDQETESGRFEMKITEIDCIIGADYVVTIHADPVAPLDDLRERWMRRPELMKAGPGYLLYEIMDEVLDDYFPVLDALDDRIDEFEERLFRSREDEDAQTPLSGDIFALRRCLIQMRRIAGPTRDVANMLLRHDADSGGKHFAYYQDLYDHATRIVDNIDTFREMLSGALDAYLATESNRMNVVMKTLTACSIILLVPNLIAAIYGMNFDDLPKEHGFYGSLGVMAGLICGLAFYFKRRNWL
ncbi:MAG: magnesium transporter [Abditibacteriota bacterium]|nr:magnesium transporter [Abditibacteriota bacterium]